MEPLERESTDEEFELLAGLVRAHRTRATVAGLAEGLAAWAAGSVSLRQAREVADLVPDEFDGWSDGAAAIGTLDLLRMAVRDPKRPWLFGLPPLDQYDSIPERTRRRHRMTGTAYVYERSIRHWDLERLVAGGRSLSAARRWLERHPELHAWDAPSPRPADRRPVPRDTLTWEPSDDSP